MLTLTLSFTITGQFFSIRMINFLHVSFIFSPPLQAFTYTNMSVNSSSAHLSFNNSSVHPLWSKCANDYVLSAYFILYILLLPLFIFVLYLGYRQWRQQRSVSITAITPADYFTYHSIVMQLNRFLGFAIFYCGNYFHDRDIVFMGIYTLGVSVIGQALIYLLICVVLYLAVVHPITYLALKNTNGVRIGNISVGCVWLLYTCLIVVGVVTLSVNETATYCLLGFVLVVISFCCISVLCALKRPGPGEAVGEGRQVHQSKQRAFNTIMVIMGVLWFRFLGHLMCHVIYKIPLLSTDGNCLLFVTVMWFDVPSFLMVPLLFLHRAGKLRCCKANIESG